MYWINDKVKNIIKKILRALNSLGSTKQCYVCKKKFFRFRKYMGGTKNLPSWYKHIDLVGSDIDNFYCVYCYCHDRERHLFAYFDKLDLWPKEKSKVLHIAPEIHLSKKIESCRPLEYIKADLLPEQYVQHGIMDVKKMSLMELPFDENYFDIVICNHVLEHVADMQKTVAEIHRVLKKGGFAILQTPFSKVFHKHFEDSGIMTDEQRDFFYGQYDHVRIVSERQFLKDLKAGFQLDVVKHKNLFDSNFAKKYGVNSKEDLIKVVK